MKLEFKKFVTPKKVLRVKEGEKHLWHNYFHHLHYMTANEDPFTSLPRSSKFFTFYWFKDGIEILIGCLGVLNQVGVHPSRRITRMVIRSEYQGLGFSKIMLDNISELYKKENITMYIATFHPRLGEMLEHSDNWAPSTNNMKTFKNSTQLGGTAFKTSIRDGVAMFRYHYIGLKDYTLEYNPLKLTELKELLKSNHDKNSKEYKKYKREIHHLERLKDENYKKIPDIDPTLLKEDPRHIKAKEEHNKIFKKKRKVLSASERKAKREELKKDKKLKTVDEIFD